MTTNDKGPVVKDMSIYPVLTSIVLFINVSHQDSTFITIVDTTTMTCHSIYE